MTYLTSSKDVYFVEAASILHNKADLGKQYSGFDSLWIHIDELLLAI